MGPYQQTPKEVARAIRFSGLGGPFSGSCWRFLGYYYYSYPKAGGLENSLVISSHCLFLCLLASIADRGATALHPGTRDASMIKFANRKFS